MDLEFLKTIDPMILYGAAGAVVLLLGLVAFLVLRSRGKSKKTNKIEEMYSDWARKLNLPPLTDNAALNEQAIGTFFKTTEVKDVVEQIEVRYAELRLTHKDAVEFAEAATKLFIPKKSKKTFVYDEDDAREGILRVYTVEEGSEDLFEYILRQKVYRILKRSAPVEDFAYISFSEKIVNKEPNALCDFTISRSGFSWGTPENLRKITEQLSKEFSGRWIAQFIAEDTILFHKSDSLVTLKAYPHEEPVVEDPNRESMPLPTLEVAKPILKEVAFDPATKTITRLPEPVKPAPTELTHDDIERLREEAWRVADERRRVAELSKRQETLPPEAVLEIVNNTDRFLTDEIGKAGSFARLPVINAQHEVFKVDGLRSPILFAIYNEDFDKVDFETKSDFAKILSESLKENFGGAWLHEYETGVVSFRKTVG